MIWAALTPDEWAAEHYEGEGDGESFYIGKWQGRPEARSFYIMDACGPDEEGAQIDAGICLYPAERHAVAALCLYGQPFGFSWADVDALRAAEPDTQITDEPGKVSDILHSLRLRIAALLPPRTP